MDRWTNGQMDRGNYNIPFAFLFFKKHGDNNYLFINHLRDNPLCNWCN